MELQGMKVKIYPNQKQKETIQQNIGNARFVWNELLNMWSTRYRNNPKLHTLSKYDLNILLPTMKQEFTFLKESDATSLQFVAESLHESFTRFFKGASRFPRFKAKKHSQKSYTSKFVSDNIELKHHAMKLPKLGWVKAKWANIPYNKIKRATVTYLPNGNYQVSVLIESENQALDPTDQVVGLDFGQTDLLVGSDGLRIPSKTYQEFEYKLKQWQRKAARRLRLAKTRGIQLDQAKNYQRAKQMVSHYHEKIRNSRLDYLHKITKRLVEEYQIIAIEDLDIRNMQRDNTNWNNHKIANQSWYELRRQLEYKSKWYRRKLYVVDPKYTSQICSFCERHDGPKSLNVRSWTCPKCQVVHDRDLNAARNILNKALAS